MITLNNLFYMKKTLMLAGCMLGLTMAASAQTSFTKSYQFADYGVLIHPLSATGEYLMVGKSIDPVSNLPTSYVRVDANGQVLGSASTSPAQSDMEMVTLAKLADGRLVAGGYDFDGQSLDATITELDANGVPQRVRNMSYGLVGYWGNLVPTRDSGFVALGMGYMTTPYYRAVIAKFDAQGDTVWTRGYGRPDFEEQFTAGTELPSGDILAVGRSDDYFLGTDPVIMHCISATGQRKWAKTYTIQGQSLRPNALVRDGEKVYLSISVMDTINFENRGGIMALDTSGNVLWAQLMAGPDYTEANAIALAPGGNPVVLGGYYTSQTSYGMSTGWSPSGNLLWSNGYYHGSSVYGVAPVQGGYLLSMVDYDGVQNQMGRLTLVGPQFATAAGCGPQLPALQVTPMTVTAANYNPTTRTGFSIIPLNLGTPALTFDDSTLCSGLVGTAVAAPSVQARVVPQPMHTHARIELPASLDMSQLNLEVYDLSGRKVGIHAQPNGGGFDLERGGMPAGIYAYQVLHDGQRVASGKLWIAD